MSSRQRQAIYLALAVIGLLGCWYFNLQWMTGPMDSSLKGFVEGGFANSASSSIAWDLTFGSLPIFVFMIVEGRRIGMTRPWLYVIAGFTIAFAFACPLFLAVRERHLDDARRRSAPVGG